MKNNFFKCSLSLVIREVQIKTPLRLNLTTVRMTEENLTGNAGKDVDKGITYVQLVGVKLRQHYAYQ